MFSFLNSFSIESFFVLFAAILPSRLVTILLKSVFVTGFAHFNFISKTAAAKLLNSDVVIYLS